MGRLSTQILVRIKYNRFLARHIFPPMLTSDESGPEEAVPAVKVSA